MEDLRVGKVFSRHIISIGLWDKCHRQFLGNFYSNEFSNDTIMRTLSIVAGVTSLWKRVDMFMVI